MAVCCKQLSVIDKSVIMKLNMEPAGFVCLRLTVFRNLFSLCLLGPFKQEVVAVGQPTKEGLHCKMLSV